MAFFSRAFWSLLIASGLGAGPYGIAVASGGGVPAPLEMFRDDEMSEFGEPCLLGEELCNIMKGEDDFEEEDQENSEASSQWDVGDGNIVGQMDDFCAWGFDFGEFIGNDTLLSCSPEPKTQELRR